MRKKRKAVYDPEVEKNKGANLTVASYDRTQKLTLIAGKVTVGGKPGIFKISGRATGAHDNSIDGSLAIWLSIFRYMRPDGTIDHVAGWNLFVRMRKGQTPLESARAFVNKINTAKTRPYHARAATDGKTATVTIIFTGKPAK